MILPIVSFGHRILREPCREIAGPAPELAALIADMWETLYAADGCGLAAPQVDRSLNLFIVDTIELYERAEAEDRERLFVGDSGIRETFINARIVDCSAAEWSSSEGCLSIPTLAEKVSRPWSITIAYLDREFQPRERTFHGSTARTVQHEYDHTRGKLYIDHLTPLRRRVLSGKLARIAHGQVEAAYAMTFTE